MDLLTRWSYVYRAGSADEHDARAALDWLVRTYAPVLRARIRRSFPHDDEDVLQEFWLTLWERRRLATVEASRGRFRSWLLTCLDHHLADRQAAADTLKRGGGRRLVGLPADDLFESPTAADPPTQLDALWATTLLTRARDRLRTDAGTEGLARFTALEPYLMTSGDAATYAAVGASLGLSESAVKVAIHRLRTAFHHAVRREVADTLVDPSPAHIAAELADLAAALGGTSHA